MNSQYFSERDQWWIISAASPLSEAVTLSVFVPPCLSLGPALHAMSWFVWFPSGTFSQKGLFHLKTKWLRRFHKQVYSSSLLASTLFHLPFLFPQEGDRTDTKLVPWMIIHVLQQLSNHAERDYSLRVSSGLRLPKACWHPPQTSHLLIHSWRALISRPEQAAAPPVNHPHRLGVGSYESSILPGTAASVLANTVLMLGPGRPVSTAEVTSAAVVSVYSRPYKSLPTSTFWFG